LALNSGGVVLCGGQSKRMGGPKEWLRCGDEYLLERVVRLVGAAVHPVVVAARESQDLPPLPPAVRVVRDRVSDCGPLAGIAAGFEALAGRCDAAFLTSCDHPLLRSGFVKRLLDLLGSHTAVVPVHEGQMYPLTAVYRLETHVQLQRLLRGPDRSAGGFAAACGALLIPAAQLADIDPHLESLQNVNDPTAYDWVKHSQGWE